MSLKQNRIIRHYILTVGLLAALISFSWFLKYNFEKVDEQESRVHNRLSIINDLGNTLLYAANAETTVRGFLITQQETYLEPYNNLKKNVEELLPQIEKKMTAYEVEEQLRDLENLEAILTRHFNNLDILINKYRDRTLEVSEQSNVLATNRSIMDEANLHVEMMKAAQMTRLQQRSAEVEKSKTSFRVSLIISTIFICTLIILVFLQIAKNYRKAEADALEKAQDADLKAFTGDIAKVISGNISVKAAGLNTLQYFARTLGLPAGRLFLRENGHFRHYAALGIDEKENYFALVQKEGAEGISLLQAAFQREDIWSVDHLPSNYWKISSSLGTAVPSKIYFLPILFQGEVMGVIELATFNDLRESQLNFLKNVQEILGTGFNAAASRERLQDLLEKTQSQSEELQAQQEELRTNNEELEQQARALESQQESLNIKNHELEQAKKQLELNAVDLRNSNQYKSDFLAKMSHELRTPLNGLLILSTLLIENKESNLSPKQLEFAKSINGAGNDLLILINDILDLSKIEARKLTIRPEHFVVKSIFEAKTRSFKAQIESKGLKFIADIPKDLEEQELYTDRQRLDQILRNFMSNAIKFTEKGSITLTAKIDDKKQNVTFSVSDTGIGISPEKHQQVFNAFEQADSSTSRRFGGTGLGLTISQELAQLLGGTIRLDSQLGKGSTFSVTVPLTFPEKDRRKLEEESAENSPLQTAKYPSQNQDLAEAQDGDHQNKAKLILEKIKPDCKTILIVEDDEKFRSSVVEVVKAYGFEPVEVDDGELAIAVLKSHIPDAILLDVRLPGISGLGILELIKELPHLRHIPVHMISAFDHQHNALRMGALGYLTKPVTLEKVQSALDRITHLLSKNLRRVLLVEDDQTQNLAVSDLISDKDIEVISVTNGLDAVEKVKNEIFDCVVLDLTLPDVSGFEILSKFNSLDVSVPPVIIYTGKDLTDEEEEHLRKYSESIVIKGARSPERLLDEVNLFLHRVESMMPKEKQEIISQLRSSDRLLEGKQILIADDDIRNIFALTSALENKGLDILVARDGVEALGMLSKNPKIDLVLMDIMMPRMDGFEAMREIRKHSNPKVREVPIVALTAKAMRGDHEKCMEAGASDYLPKPVNLDNLMTVLKVWLTPKRFLN